jgi:hypothetical protein
VPIQRGGVAGLGYHFGLGRIDAPGLFSFSYFFFIFFFCFSYFLS